MRLGILQADHVDPENHARFGDYPQMFVDVLGKGLGEGASVDFFDVRRDQYPKRIGDCDGYLITGSRASVYDDEPWIARLADFVRELDDAGAKTIGICFGHQLIAHALGGAVDRAPNGWGVGVQTWKVGMRRALDASGAPRLVLVGEPPGPGAGAAATWPAAGRQ